MASGILDILSWKQKEQSLKLFVGLNLVFYLLVLGQYSLISLFSSGLVIFIVAINTHALVHRTKYEEGDFEYISKEALEDLFISVFNLWRLIKETLNESVFHIFSAIIALFVFNFFAGVFGSEGFLWILSNLAFVLAPQYIQNKDLVDSQLGGISLKVREFRELAYDLIPKYRAGN